MPRRAFSLIELVVVVTILAIVSAMAIPRFASASARRNVDACAQRVLADLRHAQQAALARSQGTSVVFSDASDSYVVDAPDPLGAGSSYKVSLDAAPLSCQIVGVTFASDTATFDGNGLPTGDGTLTIQCGRYQRTIRVTAGTMAPDAGATAESASIVAKGGG